MKAWPIIQLSRRIAWGRIQVWVILAVLVVLRGGLVGFEIVQSLTAELFYETETLQKVSWGLISHRRQFLYRLQTVRYEVGARYI